MSSMLPIDVYDQMEHRGMSDCSVPQMMAFRPVTFAQVGYPTRVSLEEELARYVDHNFEPEVPRLFNPDAKFPPIGYVNAFTPDEKKLLDSIRDAVAAMSLRRFGRAIRPVSNLMVQMGPFRAIDHVARTFGTKQLTVFEVGPGLAYLGALLAQVGHRYLSYDITQSLYLWQNRLLSEIAPSDFVEMVLDPAPQHLVTGRVVHLPWWEYVKLLPGTAARADIVFSNSNLGEMSQLALKHVLNISRHMLADSQVGLFTYFTLGYCAQNSAKSIATEFAQFGYHKIFDRPFVAYALHPGRASLIAKAFKKTIPHFNPSSSDVRLTASEVMAVRRAEAPLDVHLSSWRYGWVPPFID
jgi:hypothetical protein